MGSLKSQKVYHDKNFHIFLYLIRFQTERRKPNYFINIIAFLCECVIESAKLVSFGVKEPLRYISLWTFMKEVRQLSIFDVYQYE